MDGIIDMHCHILPEVDDGAEDGSEALELLRMEYQQGVRKIILTPHRHKGMFEPSMERKQRGLRELRRRLRRMRIDMELYLGCEFHVESEMTFLLQEETGYTMAGSRYVLTELPMQVTEREGQQYLSTLVSSGYRPVVAHIERYEKVRSPVTVRSFIQAGAYIQVNAGSLLGAEGWGKKRAAIKLLENECIHFVGSDAHDMRRRKPRLGECAEYLEKRIGTERTRRLLIENPGKILTDEYI